MSERTELYLNIKMATAALFIIVGTLAYAVYSNWNTRKRVAKLERMIAVNDSIQQLGRKRLDSVRDLKIYNASVTAYEKAATSLFTENQNLKNSGDQHLTLLNNRSIPLRFAIAFRGINNTWFTEGIMALKPKEEMKIWGVDSSSSVYVHLEPITSAKNILINGDDLTDLNKVSLSVDTTTAFIFTGNIPPPHKTAHLALFHEVVPTVDDQIIFTDR
ncbi:MAG: hypothetical protein JWQ28_2963 [Pedobacter sp.]|jgi:hypothetical protein|nr:hypothetical protein [Pedobacter sp.]